MCLLVKLVTSVTTILMMSRTSKASFNSAKNIAAIRDQIVKDMGMDHIPDVKHVSLFNSFGKWLLTSPHLNIKMPCDKFSLGLIGMTQT